MPGVGDGVFDSDEGVQRMGMGPSRAKSIRNTAGYIRLWVLKSEAFL